MSLLNPKCAAVTAGALALYFVFPTRNDPNLLRNVAILSVGTYVGLAWYDALYDCEDKSKASQWFTLYRPLKPGVVDGEYARI